MGVGILDKRSVRPKLAHKSEQVRAFTEAVRLAGLAEQTTGLGRARCHEYE